MNPRGAPPFALLIALLALGCPKSRSSADQGPSSEAAPSGPIAPLRWRSFPRTPEPQPPAMKQAGALWTTATQAHARGELETSADRFLELAKTLNSKSAPHGPTFAATRCIAYENAAQALLSTKNAELRARFLALQDPACAHSLEGARRKLRKAQAAP